MKKLVIILVAVITLTLNLTVKAQTKLITETTLIYDKTQGGIPLNRLEIKDPLFDIKYDYKADLITNKSVNDIFGLDIPKIIDKKTFSLGAGFIKRGDWNKDDQIILYVYGAKKFGELNWNLETGRNFGALTQPWDYVMSRVSFRNFTAEGCVTSPNQLFAPSYKKLYGWIAYHPEHVFVATGNEISRNWFFIGTKKYANFGNFTFANYDRDNGNFWFRSQFGFQDVNQNFYCQSNYLVATSYLNIPLFFYKHFAPMSTKGKYAFKFEGKRVGKLENYETSFGRQFGKYGQVALGLTSQNIPQMKSGLLLEYYKEICLYNHFKCSTEFRYEKINSRLSGFITMQYSF